MMEAKDLHKSFKDVLALSGLSFCASDGRVTGLLGPNGAGKTTALRILYTALRPSKGSALVDGVDTQEDPRAVQRSIGVLPHNHGLYPRLTAREHILYFGRLHGQDERVLSKHAEELIRLLDMEDIADRRTAGFSEGQRVKVAIARALVHQPKNVILDEPTSGLDVMSTRAMRDFVRRLRDEGRCVLFSSHVMQEVSALCDDIVVLARGRVALQGTPSELCAMTGQANLEDAFVEAIGSGSGLT